MKATVEIPDALFRQAKATAAERGVSLKDLLTHALREHLWEGRMPAPPWMSALGGLRHLHKETSRINRLLEKEFERIEEDEWVRRWQREAAPGRSERT
jgi:hypothetical protein